VLFPHDALAHRLVEQRQRQLREQAGIAALEAEARRAGRRQGRSWFRWSGGPRAGGSGATIARMRPARAFAAAVALLLAGLLPADADGPAWQQWQHVVGIFDVSGPRADGRLVLATPGRLALVDVHGAVTPFAAGPGGYADDAGTEAYLAVSPGLHNASAGCDFARDDVFVLRLHQPFGVTRVDGAGQARPFATVSGVESLNGIAFDTTGRFGSRLLVSAPVKGRTAIVAIDCQGRAQVITDAAPVLEGGLAVAPAGFGAFGGALIAPDELSGRIYAIAPDGGVQTVATSGLPVGGDIGVESVAFVPPGFAHGGWAYYADRGTPGNPHPGTDSLLRLDAHDLIRLGVRDGDLLAATEGGAGVVAVRCAPTCQVMQVIGAPSVAHGEGHLVLLATPAAARPARSARGGALDVGPVVAAAALLAAVAALTLALILGAARRRR
jgi:hypothetical protein